jgi:hypothetical protein
MTENTTNNNDSWSTWVDWAREADTDSEQLWQIINTILECSQNLVQSHTRLLKRVAVLETKAGIVPAPLTAPPPADPAPAPGPPSPIVDDGAALIAQRQARAAARMAAAESAPGADVANAVAATFSHASAVPEGR